MRKQVNTMMIHVPIESCVNFKLNTFGMELTGEMPQFVERESDTPLAMKNMPTTYATRRRPHSNTFAFVGFAICTFTFPLSCINMNNYAK